MTVAAHRRSGLAGGVLASAVAGALIAGCAAQGTGGTAAGSSTASSSPASSSTGSTAGASQSPLAKGLLPTSAFGANATVVNLTLEQLQKTGGGQLGAATGLQVQPPECHTALQGTHVDPGQVTDMVGKTATTQTGAGQGTVTIEGIMTGDAAKNAVAALKNTLATCSHFTATSPQLGQAQLQFTPIDVSGVGGQAAAAAYTTTITPPASPAVTVPALLGVVQDGDRLVLLMTATADAAGTTGGPAPAAPDQGAFTRLLKQAYAAEHDALG